MTKRPTDAPLSPAHNALLKRAARLVKDQPRAFIYAGRALDRHYNEATVRTRLQAELAAVERDTPPGAPIREAYRMDPASLSPRSRAQAAIDEMLMHGMRDDFRRDMTQHQASIIVLLTAIADDPDAHESAPHCEFQRLPWTWNAESAGHGYQGRHMMRERVQQAEWLALLEIALSAAAEPTTPAIEQLRQRFKDAAMKHPPLYLTIATDSCLAVVPHWQTILGGPTWTGFHSLNAICRIASTPYFGQGQIHTRGNNADASAALDELKTLGYEAIRLLYRLGIIDGPWDLPRLELGIFWLNTLHDIASDQGKNSPLRVERTRLLRIDGDTGSNVAGYEIQDAELPIPEGKTLLFPHGEIRRIVPNLFEASAMAIERLFPIQDAVTVTDRDTTLTLASSKGSDWPIMCRDWKLAKSKAEKLVQSMNGYFPGVNALAKSVGCLKSMMSKVVNQKSAYLKARRAEKGKRATFCRLSPIITDNTPQQTFTDPAGTDSDTDYEQSDITLQELIREQEKEIKTDMKFPQAKAKKRKFANARSSY